MTPGPLHMLFSLPGRMHSSSLLCLASSSLLLEAHLHFTSLKRSSLSAQVEAAALSSEHFSATSPTSIILVTHGMILCLLSKWQMPSGHLCVTISGHSLHPAWERKCPHTSHERCASGPSEVVENYLRESDRSRFDRRLPPPALRIQTNCKMSTCAGFLLCGDNSAVGAW